VSSNSHLDRRVENLIGAYLKQTRSEPSSLPIDPAAMAQLLGNIDIEEREMIPEAAVQVLGSRFRIYLRSNFMDRPGARIRRRFSLAHEIAHTFFFEVRDGSLKPIRGAPRGDNLEAACHAGARHLLVPAPFLEKELKQACHGEGVLRLAKLFDVSIEVMLRRLRNEPAIESEGVSFTLTRAGKVEYAMYPPHLGELLGGASRGSIQTLLRSANASIEAWFKASGLTVEKLSDGSYICSSDAGKLSARRLQAGRYGELFELRRHPTLISTEELRARILGFDAEMTKSLAAFSSEPLPARPTVP
jgi:hypothetical protein